MQTGISSVSLPKFLLHSDFPPGAPISVYILDSQMHRCFFPSWGASVLKFGAQRVTLEVNSLFVGSQEASLGAGQLFVYHQREEPESRARAVSVSPTVSP